MLKPEIANDNMRNEFASHGLEILKLAVLHVLYEETDVADAEAHYASGRVLKPSAISKILHIPPIQALRGEYEYSLILGVLDHLNTQGHARWYHSQGWAITEKGIAVIED